MDSLLGERWGRLGRTQKCVFLTYYISIGCVSAIYSPPQAPQPSPRAGNLSVNHNLNTQSISGFLGLVQNLNNH